MHILLLLLIPAIFSFTGLPQKEQLILEIVILVILIPDIYLAIKNSPPFVPTFKRDLRIMLKLAHIKKGDIVYDPGCGDGRIVFAAAKKGALATGFEYAIPAYLWAKFFSLFYRRSHIVYGDFWKQDYSNADVIFCYLLPALMPAFHTKIWSQLKPGCRVVSNSFRMKDIEADETERGVHLYIKKR
jgi:hypothetical protein